MSQNFSLQCSLLPNDCCGQYTKLITENGVAYLKVDEVFQPTHSIVYSELHERWELKKIDTKAILATNVSEATEVEKIKSDWSVDWLQLNDENKFASVSFLPQKLKEKKTKRGKKRALEERCNGAAKKKRNLGRKALKDCTNVKKVSKNKIKEQFALSKNVAELELKCDIATEDDDLFVVRYLPDIMKASFEREDTFLPTPNYIDSMQPDLKVFMRSKMLDWMSSIATKFEQTDSSFHLAVNIFDRYLSKKRVPKKRLQLVGSVSLWIAAKYCEIRVAEMSDFVFIADHSFTTEDMLETEADVINTLDFQLTVPTSIIFAQRFAHVIKYMLDTEKHQRRLMHLVNFYLENCCLIYKLVGVKPSLVAAAATYAAAFWLDATFKWSEVMVRVTGYTVEDMKDIVQIIKHEIYEKESKGRNKKKLHIFTKYECRERECVSLMKYTGN